MIVAADKNNVIGGGNTLLWNLPADMKHFRTLTEGHPIIMGRKTFMTDCGLLPGRTNIVLTRDRQFTLDGAVVAHSLEEALAPYRNQDEEVFICGGAQVYEMALPMIDRMYVTKVHQNVVGDTFFPSFNIKNFEEKWREVFEFSALKVGPNV